MVALPDSLHEDGLAAVLDTGKPVFYEIPITHTRERTKPALRLLLSAPQLTHADLELGFAPVLARVAEVVGSGQLGALRTATLRTQMPWGGMANWDLCTINHLAPWYVDPLNRVLGSSPDRVLVLDGAGKPGRMQNQSTGLLDYSGIWGVLQANIDNVGPIETVLEVNGDDGDLVADLFAAELRLRTRGGPEWIAEQHADLQPRAAWPGMHECVQAFFADVERGGTGTADARTVAQLHLVGLAAEESVDSGTWAEVEALEQI
jgi:predicted dehydrogenase